MIKVGSENKLPSIKNGTDLRFSKKKKPELLAPAGNIESAITAIEYGADAVYAGLKKFNARERTENFTLKEMIKLISWIRQKNKKIYVTLNTLVKESEIREVASILKDLVDLAPDAVIIQDLGILFMIKEFFPSLTIHASTQMGFHNRAGLELARRMRIKRVILERQVTLEEIAELAQTPPVEIEVFVHGALCCGLSGKCLLSSWFGGWSGNRGKCKQPCRHRFYSPQGNGFFFSTKDLYTLDQIPQLKKMDISCLKIEGRLRKPDYVKSVVSAYRKMLDAATEDEKATLKEARNILVSSFGRKWSSGFLNAESRKNLIQHDRLGVAGLLCGEVKKIAKNGFKVDLIKELKVNDRIRIQPHTGTDGPLVTITKMTVDGKNSPKAFKGQNCFIHCDKEIPGKAKVYKVGEDLRVNIPPIETKLKPPKSSLDLKVNIDSMNIKVEVHNDQLKSLWKKNVELSEAKKYPVTENDIQNVFAAAHSDIFTCGKVAVNIKGKFFIPASVLKSIRREFWTWAEKNIKTKKTHPTSKEQYQTFIEFYSTLKKYRVKDEQKTVAIMPGDKNISQQSIIAQPIEKMDQKAAEAILPHFCPQNGLDILEEQIEKAYRNGIRRFRITSLYAIDLLDVYDDIVLTASFPLSVTNSLAASELRSLGFSKIQVWIELEKNEICQLMDKCPLPVEIYNYGRIPVLFTRAEIKIEGKISDSYGVKFMVEKNLSNGLYCLYPEAVLKLPEIAGTGKFIDLINAKPIESSFSSFNFDLEFV